MGGKTGTSTSTVSIPPEVLARYNSVNAQAQQAAATPFQQYSTDPNAFVAPINQQQQLGINATNQYANAAQPGYQAGYGATDAAMDAIQGGQNVAQPYFQGAQTIASGALPQYQQAAGLAGAAMTPLQQATYAAQPAYQAAMAGTTGAAGQLGNISQGYNAPNYQQGVAGYMNPYLQNAMGSTAAMLQNQNQQQQQQLQGNAISQGAFGGDRGNIAQAALMGQQNLAMGQTLGQMANQGYQAAAQNYLSGLGAQAGIAGQQGALANQYGQLGGQAQQALINAGLAQQQGASNIANIAGQGMAGASQYGALGTAAQNAALQGVPLSLAAGAQYGQLGAGAQAAGLQGAQAQLGAGTLQQQTQQAGLSALYNQFQQQQAYPFQVAQFLANIAEGTGALSGSTTTQTSPTSFFSDRRLKHDIHRIGETDEGLPIYKFKYKGDDKTNIGFMADEVEKVHPEAVGESHGFKTVDYDRAARYAGGLVGNSEGGAVSPMHMREGYFDGGDVINPIDLQNILAAQKQSYAPFQQGGLYGATSGGTPGGKGYVPQGNLPVSHLAVANPARTQQGETLMGDVHEAADFGQDVSKLNQYRKDIWGQKAKPAQPAQPATSSSPAVPAQPAKPATGLQAWFGDTDQPQQQYRGGLVKAYADGGDVLPYDQQDPMSQVVNEGEKKPTELKLMQSQQMPSGGSGSSTLGDLNKAVQAGQDIAWIASLFSKGGRAGFAVGGSQDSPDVDSILGSLGSIESGGQKDPYAAVGLETNGDKPYGKYQIMGANVGPWTKQYLGQEMTPQEFLGNKDAQENLMHARVGQQLASGMSPDDIASIHFTGKPASQAGNPHDVLGTSKNDYLAKFRSGLGAADMPAENAASVQTVGAQGAQGFQPPGENQPKTLGDALTSESILIPLLSGLGAMASSNSRYLGSALLQGIGAGAKSYEDVQNQMLERRGLEPIVQQRNIQTLSDLTSGLAEYNSKMGTNLTLPQYAAMVNYKGQIPANAVSGGTSTAGQGSAAGQSFVNQGYTYTPQEMQNLVIDRNGVQIKAMNDPLYMQGYAAHWRQAGNNQFAQNQVSFANEQIARNSTYTRDVNGNMVASPGSISTGQQVQYAGNKVAQANKFVDQGNDLSASYGTTRQALQDLQDAYSKYRAGSLGTDRSALDRIAQELDPDGKIPALHGLSQDSSSEQYDIAMKSAAQLVARQLQGMSTVAPKSEIGLLNSFAANPDMSPGAIRSIIVRGKALVDYNQALHSNFSPENENFDVQNYINKFNSSHDYSNEFIGKNEKETPWMKGQAPAVVQNENDIAKLPSGAPFVVPYGPSKGQIRYAP
jgi:Chaperone of endosialidase